MNRKLLAITLLLGLSGTPLAYEIGTHALVTQTAVSRSVLSPTQPKSIVSALGFERLDVDKPFEAAVGVGGLPEPRVFDRSLRIFSF